MVVLQFQKRPEHGKVKYNKADAKDQKDVLSEPAVGKGSLSTIFLNSFFW